MSGQNRYRIYRNYKSHGWDGGEWTGDTWQDAIRDWLDEYWISAWGGPYQVMSETPSEDGRSGSMYIQHKLRSGSVPDHQVKATLIENE